MGGGLKEHFVSICEEIFFVIIILIIFFKIISLLIISMLKACKRTYVKRLTVYSQFLFDLVEKNAPKTIVFGKILALLIRL